MQPLYDMKNFRPTFDPKSAEVFAKPIQAFDETYGELFRYELDTSQKAWTRAVAEMQELSARWVARRQAMMSDYALWFDPANTTKPAEFTLAWRRFATNSAQRLIEDMSDQMEVALRAATRLGEALEPSATPAKATAPKAPRTVHARTTIKARRSGKSMDGEAKH